MFTIKQIEELYWEGYLENEAVCQFEYFKDSEGRYWVNNIVSYGKDARKGYGTKMIVEALKVYGRIYISTAEKYEIKQRRLENDLRYNNDYSFEESNIGKFSKRLVEKGILESDSICHPFNII